MPRWSQSGSTSWRKTSSWALREEDLGLGRGVAGDFQAERCEGGKASHGVVGVAPLGHDGMEVPP